MAKIVVADDHPWIVRQIRHRLEQDGHTVLTAYDGERALQLIRQERPELILLDVNMPRLDGLRVLHRLREEPEFKNTPVVLITALAHPEDIGLASRLGVDCYLTKPFQPEEVALVARRLLESRANARLSERMRMPMQGQMSA